MHSTAECSKCSVSVTSVCTSLPQDDSLAHCTCTNMRTTKRIACGVSVLQVKEAIPSVEERTYRKGQILVEQGRVPEGLFLILHGECELVISTYLQEPDSPAAAIRVQQSGPSLAAIKKDSDIDFAAHLSSSSCSDESDRDTQEESEENASYSPLARSMRLPDILYVSQAAHVVDEASAVRAGLLLMDEAPTLSAQLQEQLTAALEHPFPLAATADEANNGTDQAAAATAGLAARDVLSVEQILPQLLPQPRWPGLPVIQSDCGSGSPSLSGIDVGSSRQASKSAGPVMLGAAADGADTSLPGQEGAANAAAAASPGSSSPRIPFGYSRARQKSMSFDTSHTGMPSNYSPTASVGWVSDADIAGIAYCLGAITSKSALLTLLHCLLFRGML